MKISNLAICFYGQWRSGKICVPYLKSIIDNMWVDNIDVFCSVKDSLSFHATANMRKADTHFLSDDEKSDIADFLLEVLSPASVNFISDPPGINMGIETADGTHFNHHGVLTPSGVIDTLLLKQRHEARTGVFYDAVILMRYDVLYRPPGYLPKLLDKIKAADDLAVWPNDPDSILAPASNHAFRGNDHGRYTMFPDMINDLFIMFTGTAADRMCYEMIEYMHAPTSLYGNDVVPKYVPYIDYMNFHVMFGRLAGQISLPMIRTPGISERISDDGVMDDIEVRLNNDITTEIHMICARPNETVMQLDPSKLEDYWKIGEQWYNA